MVSQPTKHVHLPDDLITYGRSPEFDQDTLPAALQKKHTTKEGSWALIHVMQGRLLYRILEPFSETVLESGKPGLIQPRQPHEVEIIGPVRMFVEFYSKP
ncbi:DUF1971 domain-containing protein [Ochrobactrum sp. MYb379]|uniref:DUF1971 domain-containing protein n=1 Tax=Ochrobactrum sp. MYb379 TaxID=2745275 RepID=UPI003095B5F1